MTNMVYHPLWSWKGSLGALHPMDTKAWLTVDFTGDEERGTVKAHSTVLCHSVSLLWSTGRMTSGLLTLKQTSDCMSPGWQSLGIWPCLPKGRTHATWFSRHLHLTSAPAQPGWLLILHSHLWLCSWSPCPSLQIKILERSGKINLSFLWLLLAFQLYFPRGYLHIWFCLWAFGKLTTRCCASFCLTHPFSL